MILDGRGALPRCDTAVTVRCCLGFLEGTQFYDIKLLT